MIRLTFQVVTLLAELALTVHGDVHPRHAFHVHTTTKLAAIARDKE